MAVTNCSASLAKNIKALNNERGMLISNATGKARNEFLEFTVREQVKLRMAYNKALKNIQNDIQKLTARGRLTPLRLTQLRKNIKAELRALNTNITRQVKSGMRKSVNYGVRASMEGIKDTLPAEFSVGLTSDAFTQINIEAMQFLVKFPVDGIALSERIWRHHQTAFQQIMKEVTAGMVTGRSSARISRDIRQYLIDPIGTGSRAGNIKALRTRARNAVLAGEKGRAARLFASANNLETILRTEYPVGRGIYRSAHKNAMRVARTETNRAFHEGQIQYYRRKNWVVGVKWRLSFSHPKYDICDSYATANIHGLGPGGYTKTSVPGKPHPHCFCYTVSILDRNRLFGQKGITPRRTDLNRGQVKGILDRRHKRLGISGKGKEDFVLSRSASSYQAVTPEAKDSLSMFTDARGNLTKQRQELHDAIVAKHLRGVKSSNAPETVIMGGGPASGKSTAQRAIGLDDWQKGNRVFIDSDEIKKLLPEFTEGLKQGNAGAAAFSHLESSMISQRIVDEAVRNKFHFILDGTGDGSLEKLAGRIARYRAQDSKIIAHYVTVDTNVAVARSLARAKATGRLVPEQFIRDTHAGVSRVLPQAIERGLFDEITLWDTGGKKIFKIIEAKGKKLVILDEEAWKKFLEKAFPLIEMVIKEDTVVVETEDLERILLEVVNGLEPAVPDTPEFAAKRRQLQIDVDEIIARGEIVDIPFELP